MPGKQSLVRMINSQNNERLFFADRVVLVEGISDRLVLESLIDNACNRFNSSLAVEIIEVGGKNNFSDYEVILKGLLTPTFTVADRDYLTIIGSASSRELFTSDVRKQWEVLTADKKSTDRGSTISNLASAISSGDLGELKRFWEYFTARRQALKDPLNPAQEAVLENDLSRLRNDNVFVLRRGEIESGGSGSSDRFSSLISG
jgi:putative ATP-dependent endonuclease of OLD family